MAGGYTGTAMVGQAGVPSDTERSMIEGIFAF
jgi:hypothetical protein